MVPAPITPALATLRPLRQAGHLARFSFGEKDVDQRLRLERGLRAVGKFLLEQQTGFEGHRCRRAHCLDRGQAGLAIRILALRLLLQAREDGRRCARRIDVAIRGPPHPGAAAHQGAGVGDGGRTQIALDFRIDETLRDCGRHIHRLPRQYHLQCALDADEPRHALRPAGAGNDAQSDLGKSESGAG
jgi:hypothetical protein